MGDAEIAGITADSRAVAPGFIFAALPGARADGRAFIAQAVAQGAAAILAPEGTIWPEGVPARPLLTDPNPRRTLALLAAAHAGAQPRCLVAVTGTNGKTSTADFLRQIFALAGHPAASLGTLGLIAPGFAQGAGLTTPDPVTLAGTLASLARAGIQHAAMEASSHGLDQFRLDGARLTAAGFTNLTRDHLDYHGDMSAYRAAKLRLFSEVLPAGSVAVASADMDAETLAELRQITTDRRLDLRTIGEAGTAIRLIRATPRPDGLTLLVESAGKRREIDLPLPGRFQADNALMAAALADAVGNPDPLSLLPSLTGVRGRMELAARLNNGAAVYVDYAHTPDALERLLQALRPHASGRLHVVFGAGGDRDAGKRPLMGAIAARMADSAIVTDDNPRSENPAAIRAAILAGMGGSGTRAMVREVGDREAAIASALSDLGPGDVLALAGKGHEQGQIVANQTLPFDDAAVVRRLAGVPSWPGDLS